MNTRRNLIGGLGAGVLGLMALGALGGSRKTRPGQPGTRNLPNTPLFNQQGRRFAASNSGCRPSSEPAQGLAGRGPTFVSVTGNSVKGCHKHPGSAGCNGGERDGKSAGW